MKIKLGQYNELTVVKKVDFGLYLDGGDAGEILLPRKLVPEGTAIGDTLNVFIYLDNEERPVATTETPFCQVGDFACLEVAWVNAHGAFLKWGLLKDLFCPFREQKRRMAQGEHHVVHVHVDRESYRIMASAKVEHFLSREMPPYHHGDEVELLVWQPTELGFKVIVDNQFAGLVYKDQVYRHVQTGDRMKGYIDTVRPDGKIDVTLQPTGRQQTLDFSQVLLDYLQLHGGYCPLGDKSDADDIKDLFHVSKKTFKRAVGDLYKRRLITLQPDGLHLV